MEKIIIKKPIMRWLFGGFGFHNSEATMTPMMSDEFLNQRVLKTFREISPTFSRVFAGYANWSKPAMDAFADYYDQTFRKARTTLYVVPGRMPMPSKSFQLEDYCEQVAANLEYLIRERKLAKLRYYCATNELSCGNSIAYFLNHMEDFKKVQEELYDAFYRHSLNIGLMSTDVCGTENFDQIAWATEHMDEITECYCAHHYMRRTSVEDLDVYENLYQAYSGCVQQALKKSKRFVLGEYGNIFLHKSPSPVMARDVAYGFDNPEEAAKSAISLVETAIAAVNSGCMAAAYWTMFDYPDPFLREDGDNAVEKGAYDVARFSGFGTNIRYNKHGLIRWDEENQDYSARPALYTLGYFAKFFKKGMRVLVPEITDKHLRCAAVSRENSITICVINWANTEKHVSFSSEELIDKPLRKYVYESGNVPFHPCNDLQPYSDLIETKQGMFQTVLPPMSVVYLTTDYIDRTPSEIRGIKQKKGVLQWKKCQDVEHCYYRIYKNGKQIASTVSESVKIEDACARDIFTVYSVDNYGNCNKL